MTPEYRAWLIELFGPLGSVSVKPMFGFDGIYIGRTIFALVANERLYLKADDSSRAPFRVAGMGAFEFVARNGERTITSYWEVPGRLYDEPDELREWAKRAYEVALNSSTAKGKRTRRAR